MLTRSNNFLGRSNKSFNAVFKKFDRKHIVAFAILIFWGIVLYYVSAYVFRQLSYTKVSAVTIEPKVQNIIIADDEKFNRQALSHKSRCYSCEKDMASRCGDQCAWRAQPAKSYDSEADLVGRQGVVRDGYGAKTIKYY